MDLQPMVMERNAARRAFLEYRDAFREQGRRIDAELMRGYRELAAGKQLIRLSETISQGGADELGRPRLAVARADEQRVEFWRAIDGRLQFSPPGQARASSRRFTYPAGTLPVWEVGKPTDWWGWSADVPLIPPRFRPPFQLANYTLLWEALWRQTRTRAALDPALLRHIGGDLFAVLAVWDLTPLERAVLESR